MFDTEVELAEACKKNNRKALQVAYSRYAPKMLGVCMRYMHNKTESEDVLQEAFIKIFQSVGSYTFIGSFEGWIRKIVVNTALNYLRDNAKYKNNLDIEEEVNEGYYSDIDYDSISVEMMLQALQSLPDGYRMVFNLYEIEGYSHNEISEILGVSISTSKSQLFKAKKYLQNKLLNQEDFI